jgi:probable DNA repair protein
LPYDDLLAHAQAGHPLITANQRLARTLRLEWQARQTGPSWHPATVLPYEAWLRDQYTRALLSGSVEPRVLLQPQQELALWSSILARDLHAIPLLTPYATAEQAQQAYRILRDFQSPSLKPTGHPDCDRFASWSETYQRMLDQEGWIDAASLAATLPWAPSSAPALWAGFDRLTPAQARIQEQTAARLPAPRSPSPTIQALRADSFEHELELAAEWASGLLTQNRNLRIGILVPSLATSALACERTFGLTLDHGHLGAFRNFELSTNRSLFDLAPIHDAWLLMGLFDDPLPASLLSRLLLSPFLRGAESESAERAQIDRHLRERELAETSLTRFLNLKPLFQAPRFLKAVRAADRLPRPPSQSFRAWSLWLDRILSEFGWPGEAPPSTTLFQAREAFHRALTQWTSLDLVAPPPSLHHARAALGQILRDSPFQPESHAAPVQILGLLESAGSEFDALWITGLHDANWPPPATPNPFLPLDWQRRVHAPNASHAVQHAYAYRITQRLLASAPHIVVSCPARDGEVEFAPSPLLAHLPFRDPDPRPIPIRPDVPVSFLHDPAGPPADPAVPAPGGASALRDQAACPFRSFARHRLQASELSSPSDALDARDRGTIVHRALETFWNLTRSLSNLRALTESERLERLTSSLDDAFRESSRESEPWQIQIARLERDLLLERLTEWLTRELHRPPFTVETSESSRIVDFGGLRWRIRLDRVDRLPDGRLVLIDYKTGKFHPASWNGERPAEPQMPFYAAVSAEPLAAVLIARLRKGELGFLGISTIPSSAPDDPKPVTQDDLEARIDNWRAHLQILAQEVARGHAIVDPREPKDCRYCHLTAFCRRLDSPEQP